MADIHSAILRGTQWWTKYVFLQDTQQKDNSDNQEKKKNSHRDWALGQAATVELPSLGGFQTGLEEAQGNLIQPSNQRCFTQDTGPAHL